MRRSFVLTSISGHIAALSVGASNALRQLLQLLVRGTERGAEDAAAVVHVIGWWLALAAGVAAISWSLWRWATRSGS